MDRKEKDLNELTGNTGWIMPLTIGPWKIWCFQIDPPGFVHTLERIKKAKVIISYKFHTLYLLLLRFFLTTVFFHGSWRKYLHRGVCVVLKEVVRILQTGSSVPRYSCASCAQPSCLHHCSTWRRSTHLSAHPEPSRSSPRWCRAWPASPSQSLESTAIQAGSILTIQAQTIFAVQAQTIITKLQYPSQSILIRDPILTYHPRPNHND